MAFPGFSGGLVVKNLPANAGNTSSISGLRRSLGVGNIQPTPVFLPGESPGQGSLVDYGQWVPRRLGHDLVTTTTTTNTYLCVCVCVCFCVCMWTALCVGHAKDSCFCLTALFS